MRPWIEAVNEYIIDRPGVRESVIKSVRSESCDGYISLNDGGWQVVTSAELYGAYIENNYPVSMQTYIDYSIQEYGKDNDEFDEDLQELFWYYKVFCFLQDNTAIFQVYLCLDEYGRDYISWLRCYGSNPNQTVGTWEVVIPVEEIEERLPEITRATLEELERLHSLPRNDEVLRR